MIQSQVNYDYYLSMLLKTRNFRLKTNIAIITLLVSHISYFSADLAVIHILHCNQNPLKSSDQMSYKIIIFFFLNWNQGPIE